MVREKKLEQRCLYITLPKCQGSDSSAGKNGNLSTKRAHKCWPCSPFSFQGWQRIENSLAISMRHNSRHSSITCSKANAEWKCTELVDIHHIYTAETESRIELMLTFKTRWSFLSGNGSGPWSYARNYSCLLKKLIVLLLLSPDVSFWLYVISPEEFYIFFHGMGQ